jgi:hypothetical protein
MVTHFAFTGRNNGRTGRSGKAILLAACVLVAAAATAAYAVDAAPATMRVAATKATVCENNCKKDRNDCMAEVKNPGGPKPQQCVQEYKGCLNACKKKKT